MEIRARIEIKVQNKEILDPLLNALVPETVKSPSERSRSIISVSNDMVIIDIFTNDLISLRAAINSYFKWLLAITRSLEVIMKWQKKRK